jgi:hypothetical protein
MALLASGTSGKWQVLMISVFIAFYRPVNRAPVSFYVVRYSCDVTDAKLIPLPYDGNSRAASGDSRTTPELGRVEWHRRAHYTQLAILHIAGMRKLTSDK